MNIEIKLLFVLFSLSYLTACGQTGDNRAEEQNAIVDKQKLDKVTADFHMLFMDDDFNTYDLNDKEIALYFEQKSLLDLNTPGKTKKYPTEFEIGDESDSNQNGNQNEDHGTPISGDPPAKDTPKDTPKLSYVERCEKLKVPIPPPWATGGWKEMGDLKKKDIFIAPEFNPLTIWRYKSKTSPKGTCAATVRYKKGTTKAEGKIQEIGIICQGEETGNACFWVAKTRKKGEQVKDMLDADNIPEERDKKPLNCSHCHRGDNAFIVHPETILKKFSVSPDNRYKPVSKKKTWSNPLDKPPYNDLQCGECHNFAEVTKPWCEFVLQKALGKTMPIDNDGKLITPKSKWKKSFKADMERLKLACKKVGYTLTF